MPNYKMQQEDWLTLFFLCRPALTTILFLLLSSLLGLTLAHLLHGAREPVRPVDCVVYAYVIFRGRRLFYACRRRLSIRNLKK